MMRRARGFSRDDQLFQLYENMNPDYKLYISFDDVESTGDLANRAAEFKDIEKQQLKQEPKRNSQLQQ